LIERLELGRGGALAVWSVSAGHLAFGGFQIAAEGEVATDRVRHSRIGRER